MVSGLGASSSGSNPGRGQCVVFFSASHHPVVYMGTGELNVRG